MTAGKVGFGATGGARQRGDIYIWVETCSSLVTAYSPCQYSTHSIAIRNCASTEILRQATALVFLVLETFPSHFHAITVAREAVQTVNPFPRRISSPQPDARQLKLQLQRC